MIVFQKSTFSVIMVLKFNNKLFTYLNMTEDYEDILLLFYYESWKSTIYKLTKKIIIILTQISEIFLYLFM